MRFGKLFGSVGRGIGSLFGGRKAPQPPNIPSPPALPEIMDVIDEINRTETITTTGVDGKKRRIIRSLPRTPEEEAIFKKSQELMSQAMTNIENLYKYDPDSVVEYQPFIEAFTKINAERLSDLEKIGDFGDIAAKVQNFKQLNAEIMNREFDRQERMAEEILAERGLGRSTLAAEERAARATERSLAKQQSEVMADAYGEDLVARQLAREKQLYDVREQGRTGRLQEAQIAYELERQKQADLEEARQRAIAENQNFLQIGQNAVGNERDRARLAAEGGVAAQNLAHQQAVAQNQRYTAQVGGIMDQYRMNLAHYDTQPQRFGARLLDTGFALAGQTVGNRMSGSSTSTNAAPVQVAQPTSINTSTSTSKKPYRFGNYLQ